MGKLKLDRSLETRLKLRVLLGVFVCVDSVCFWDVLVGFAFYRLGGVLCHPVTFISL